MRSLASSATIVATSTDTVSELIVERLPGRSSLAAMSLIENEFDLDATLESKIANRLEVIQLDQPITRSQANELVKQLVDTGKVESAEINEKRYAVTAPNDPEYVNQWYLKDFATINKGIGIEDAWSHSTGSPTIVVAIIDTGYTPHLDLPTPLAGYDFFDNDADATDPGDAGCGEPNSWHGTKVAGVIGAKTNNGIGIAGINQQSQIQHIRILGPCGGETDDEIKAIRWAAGLPVDGISLNPTPARVINLSLGGVGPCSTNEQEAINAAVAAGSVVVVAAGNGDIYHVGQDLDIHQFAPANCNNVITVAATTSTGARAGFTNFGSTVEIAAPGTNIKTTTVGGYTSVDGTSFSAPIISGIVSLMMSVNPTLDYNGVLALLSNPDVANPFPALSPPTITSACSSNINDTYYCGLGIIDAAHSVHAAALIAPEVFSPMQPVRVADTRPSGFVSADNSLVLDLKGTFGLPNAGLGAVALNVTATGALQDGYVTVWPCAEVKPTTSSVNYTAGEDIPNTVIASPDQYGKLCLDSSTPVNLIVDLSGWFISGDGLHTFTPERAFDLRQTGLVITPDTPYAFQMTGNFGIPTTGVSSVVLNVTATGATAPGYITVWPCNQPQPYTSNLNYLAYQDIPNAVIATVDSNGQVCFASSSPTFLITDISGWFAQGSNLNVVTPLRLFDTRPAKRVTTTPIYVLDLSATSPVVQGAATAIVLNVTATGASKAGFATVWPCDEAQPPTSNLNFDANEDIPNLVITKVSASNTVCFNASTPVHLIADLMGWFAP